MNLRAIIRLGFITLLAASCTVREDVTGRDETDDVSLDFSFSLQPMEITATKADAGFTELNPAAGPATFRGLDHLRVLPFTTGSKNPVVADSRANGAPRGLPAITDSQDDAAYSDGVYHQGVIKTNHAHFYPYGTILLPSNTSSLLIYGKAPTMEASTEVEEKMLNGSLIEEGWDGYGNRRAQSILFSPDPIYSETTAAVASEVAAVLNGVAANAVYEVADYYWLGTQWATSKASVSWDENCGDKDLKDWFLDFTGNGDAVPGSGAYLKARLTTLRQRLLDYTSKDETVYQHDGKEAKLEEGGNTITYGYLYNQLRDFLLSRVETALLSDALQRFPASVGLPAGAVTFCWDNASGFFLKVQGFDGLLPATSFCYMPALYYYANTHLSTSYNRYIYEQYNQDNSWDAILAQYSAGKVVTGQIKAVALDQPLQYAAALLGLTVKASSATLPDNDGNDGTNCDASGHHFPVTGIVLGSQYQQNFEFLPVVDDTQDADEYFMYDGLVDGVYLTTSQSAQLRSLSLSTPVTWDVYFFLELRNDSGAPFTGRDGVVPDGCKFYLAGKLDAPAQDAEINRVFMQDAYTKVDCTVSTLANAYLSIPQAGDPELSLGVRTAVNWYFSPGSYAVMD